MDTLKEKIIQIAREDGDTMEAVILLTLAGAMATGAQAVNELGRRAVEFSKEMLSLIDNEKARRN